MYTFLDVFCRYVKFLRRVLSDGPRVKGLLLCLANGLFLEDQGRVSLGRHAGVRVSSRTTHLLSTGTSGISQCWICGLYTTIK